MVLREYLDIALDTAVLIKDSMSYEGVKLYLDSCVNTVGVIMGVVVDFTVFVVVGVGVITGLASVLQYVELNNDPIVEQYTLAIVLYGLNADNTELLCAML